MEISILELFCQDIQKQKKFYSQVLGFQILEEVASSFSVSVGTSILKYTKDANATPYHFAFNIPSNKIEEAHEWVQKRTEILKDGEVEIHDFESWNAKAIYFKDAENSIVEFIARKNLRQHSQKAFDINDVLSISEIGIPTANVLEKFEWINTKLGLRKYSGDFKTFCAAGDESGLFIIIDKNKRNWFPINAKAHSSPFKAKIKIDATLFNVKYSENDFDISVQS